MLVVFVVTTEVAIVTAVLPILLPGQCTRVTQEPLQVQTEHSHSTEGLDTDQLLAHIPLTVNQERGHIPIGVVRDTVSADNAHKFGFRVGERELLQVAMDQRTFGDPF